MASKVKSTEANEFEAAQSTKRQTQARTHSFILESGRGVCFARRSLEMSRAINTSSDSLRSANKWIGLDIDQNCWVSALVGSLDSIETKWQSPWTFTAGGTLPSSKSSRLEPLILEFAGQTLGRTWSPVTEARHTPSRALRLTVDKTVLISSRDEGASFNSKLFCHLQALVQRKTKSRIVY
ncbi:hypothetical protein RRG08_032061 [Elysia crispata]|uniref:Uncharacterized protein n=1 Tax=Elysia crispata TaxID=231223 RepID=A0AAE0ZGT2_9GAST|nr:hypothetical protein RRG08_032061 [Elysia crispata]